MRIREGDAGIWRTSSAEVEFSPLYLMDVTYKLLYTFIYLKTNAENQTVSDEQHKQDRQLG